MTHPMREVTAPTGAGRTLAVRALRGAIQVDRDDPATISTATATLVREVLARNGITADDVISVFFTMTPDLVAAFPAAAAREIGLADVPLLCSTEIAVPGALPRVIRLLAHIETSRPRSALRHVYLHGAERLRPDLRPDTTPSSTDGRTLQWSS